MFLSACSGCQRDGKLSCTERGCFSVMGWIIILFKISQSCTLVVVVAVVVLQYFKMQKSFSLTDYSKNRLRGGFISQALGFQTWRSQWPHHWLCWSVNWFPRLSCRHPNYTQSTCLVIFLQSHKLSPFIWGVPHFVSEFLALPGWCAVSCSWYIWTSDLLYEMFWGSLAGGS